MKGPGAPAPSLFLDQTDARRAEKIVLGDHPPPSPRVLSQGLGPALLFQNHL